MEMKVSIAVCTWNRASLLDQTLSEMQGLRIPAGVEWEVIVVDNGSTDETGAVIARHAKLLPIRSHLEPVQGIAQARNRAVAEASGELLLFTDDDCLVEPDWLTEYLAAAARWPDAVYFGGAVSPQFATTPPRWITENLDRLQGPFAIRDFGQEVRPLGRDESLFNANMAYRTTIVRDHPYDTRFGSVGKRMVGGEEIELAKRLTAHGHGGIWVGTARVRHQIPAERMTDRFVWAWHRGSGKTMVQLDGVDACPRVFGAPRWAIRRYLTARTAALLLPMRGPRWFDAMARAAHARGVIEAGMSLGKRLS
jgi:glycosyltransferase involved in cell wall biosynthesis